MEIRNRGADRSPVGLSRGDNTPSVSIVERLLAASARSRVGGEPVQSLLPSARSSLVADAGH